ncbi:UNVERIFIED_CONTAM: hypothetical protein FKN15_010791 [Acipenser sinensis]
MTAHRHWTRANDRVPGGKERQRIRYSRPYCTLKKGACTEMGCFVLTIQSLFLKVEAGTPWRGNYVLEKHLDTIERTAFNKGLPPEGIDIMIDFALGLRMGSVLGVRVMKTLIPATVVPQSSLIKGVSWFCVGKLPSNLQVMFFRWFITVFDLVDSKEQLHLLYGFLFCFLTDEHLCPYICHLLYLLTTKESVKHYRIRRLLDLQAKIKWNSNLNVPLVSSSVSEINNKASISLSRNAMLPLEQLRTFSQLLQNVHRIEFPAQMGSVLNSPLLLHYINCVTDDSVFLRLDYWLGHALQEEFLFCKDANKQNTSEAMEFFNKLITAQQFLQKWNSNLNVPLVSSSVSEINNKASISLSRNAMLPLEQLRTFSQLLQNVHRIEFPAQMGSVLNSPLLLHYINCVTDDSVFLRLDYWLGHALQEEFLFCKDANKQNTSEAMEFFNKLITAQQFLQEGFSSCETFIYKFLHVWNGSEYRSQILSLLSWIPMAPVTDMKQLLCEPLMLLFFSSSVFFKSAFKNYDSNWKTAIAAVQKKSKVEILMQLPNNIAQKTTSRKRKWNSNLNVPLVSSSVSEINNKASISLSRNAMLPLEQLRTFSQLLQNVHRIEFPAQMGSVLNSPLLLHYINCVTDDSVFLRLDYWLGHALQEEFLFCKDANKQNTSEAMEFFNKLITAQQFLQEGFSSCETFIYKFLHVWNGSEYRSQILSLLSWIPMAPVTDMKQLLCEPLMLLFFSSSVFFKCSVIECLNNMLVNWLTWHSVYATEDIDMNLPGHSPMNMTLSELVNSVIELVQFTGRISTIGLHLEGYNTLLLHFVLSFYETVSDMYLKYDMPLVIMPPGGVFYPALISLDPISVNQLCHIMYRYRTNLVSAKDPELQRKKRFHISSKTYSEYNQYVVSMVNCLWKSKAFIRDNHPMGIEVNPKLLNETKVAEYRNSFNIVHHPALMGYAIDFFQKGRHWDWYLEYLYGQGFHGLRQFIESSITRVDHSVSRIGKR